MREILFRGQTRRKGERIRLDGTKVDSNWVYGGIFPNNDGGDFAIIYQQKPEIEKFPVYADTVCQYTGLTDKNGNKIFEGDIVKTKFFGKCCGHVNYADYDIFKIVYNEGAFYLENSTRKFLIDERAGLEVIGNIFDNPDLLECD